MWRCRECRTGHGNAFVVRSCLVCGGVWSSTACGATTRFGNLRRSTTPVTSRIRFGKIFALANQVGYLRVHVLNLF